MTLAPAPCPLYFSDGPSPKVAWAIGLSLAFHGLLLLLLTGLRLAGSVERPQASIEVSLVSLASVSRPASTVKPAVPITLPKPAPEPPAKPAPVRSVERPEPDLVSTVPPKVIAPAPPMPRLQPPSVTVPRPAPPPAPSPVPAMKATAPKVAPVTVAPPPRPATAPKAATDKLLTDLLKEIELPPEVPRLGDLPPPAPAAPLRQVDSPKPDPTGQKLSSRIRDLRIPEVAPGASVGKSASTPAPTAPARPIVSPDILEKLQKPIEPIERLPERQATDPSEMRMSVPKSAASAAPPAAAVSSEVMPSTTIQAAGTGTSRYWALVQQRINSRWVAPPVDLTQRYFLVVIRFTMDRSGKVIGVVVERSSGNDYYDNAGRRAVLSADPLPPFPSEIKEQQLSPLIYFSVGEPAG